MIIAAGLLFSSPCLGSSLQTEAIRVLRNDVAQAVPGGKKMSRVAVLDFKGDENNLVKNAVISAINERNGSRVMERVDFDRILAEQGLQLKDIMDEGTRIRHGRLAGVQGLLMGDVYRLKSGFMSYDLKANVRLVDVERGEVLLARDFEASAVSPLRKYVIGGSGTLAFLLAALLFVSARARRKKKFPGTAGVGERADHKEGMVAEIDKIMGNVSEAKSRLVETGNTADAVELKDIERNLMQMKRSVVHGIYGLTNAVGAPFSREPRIDRDVLWRLVDLESLSRKIRLMALTPHGDEVNREIGILRAGIGEVEGGLAYGRASSL